MPFVVVNRGSRDMREVAAYQWTPSPIREAGWGLVVFHVDDMARAESQAERYLSGMMGARACADADVLQTVADMAGILV